MKQTWRQSYAPEIAQIIADNEGKSVKELKKILHEANPGQYGWMIKTWASESMQQLGLSKKKRKETEDKNQQKLFQ